MDHETLGMVVASVLGGLSVLVALVAVAFQPFLLLVALPLAAAAYLLWQGAMGDFGRAPWRTRRVDPREADRAREARRERGAAGDGPGRGDGGRQRRGAGRRRRAQDRRDRAGRDRAEHGRAGDDADGGYWRGPTTGAGPSERERAAACRTLGVPPGADEETVKRAYRERVKEVHPDADDGDEEAFKRVTRAYETLVD